MVILGVFAAAGVALAQDKSAVATIKQCTLTLIEQAEVPAQEAGVLKSVATKEGRQVTNGDLLAQVDDAKTQMELKVAKAKLAAAKEKATDDINIRYSKASAEVAKADYEVNAEANRKVPGSVPQEVLREKLMKCVESSWPSRRPRWKCALPSMRPRSARPRSMRPTRTSTVITFARR